VTLLGFQTYYKCTETGTQAWAYGLGIAAAQYYVYFFIAVPFIVHTYRLISFYALKEPVEYIPDFESENAIHTLHPTPLTAHSILSRTSFVSRES
jgi:hypothetical protein